MSESFAPSDNWSKNNLLSFYEHLTNQNVLFFIWGADWDERNERCRIKKGLQERENEKQCRMRKKKKENDRGGGREKDREEGEKWERRIDLREIFGFEASYTGGRFSLGRVED